MVLLGLWLWHMFGNGISALDYFMFCFDFWSYMAFSLFLLSGWVETVLIVTLGALCFRSVVKTVLKVVCS